MGASVYCTTVEERNTERIIIFISSASIVCERAESSQSKLSGEDE